MGEVRRIPATPLAQAFSAHLFCCEQKHNNDNRPYQATLRFLSGDLMAAQAHEISGNLHGSGAGSQDPSAGMQTSQQAAVTHPRAPEQAKPGHTGADVPITANEEEFDMTLTPSESSPPRPYRPRMAARRRAASRSESGERRSKLGVFKIGGSSTTKRFDHLGNSRPPSPDIAGRLGKWAAQRTPSPATQRVEVGEHKVIMPTISDTNDRIVALEQQRNHDHEYFKYIAAAIEVMNTALGEERDKRLNLEAEAVKMDFTRRQETASLQERILAEVPARMATFVSGGIGPKLDEQFAEANRMLIQVQGDVQQLRAHEAKVEKYLQGLEADRPREGQAIQQLVDTEVGQVRDLVQKFEASGQAVPKIGAAVVPFTTEMFVAIRNMENKISTVDQVVANYNLLADKVNVAHLGFVEHHGRLSNAEARITTAETQIAAHNAGLFVQGDQYTAPPSYVPTARLPRAPALNLTAAFQAGAATAATCGDSSCGDSSCQGATNAAGPPMPPGVPQGQMPGSSGDGNPMGAVLQRVTAGNGVCHCLHVTKLMEQVAALEQRPAAPAPDLVGRHDPWGAFGGAHGAGGAPRGHATPAHAGQRGPKSLPLTLKGPLGAIGYKDRGVFDEKLALQEEYRFNGSKGGLSWKGKTERYFISRAPILKDILDWAEECDLDIFTVEKLQQAVGIHLTEEQVLNLNAAIWGFLSGAVSGTAEIIFKRAETLNGIDAWRRLAHYVEHGKEIRLENLRREVKMLHTKPIASLDKVEEGVAEWENTMNEYALAGGTSFSDAERKADLLAVLPAELRELMLWNSTKTDVSFDVFRDHVITQSSKILMNRRKLPIHAIEGNEFDEYEGFDFQGIDFSSINSAGDMIAAFERAQRKGQFRGRRDGGRDRRDAGRDQGGGGRERDESRPRRCPNCSEAHPGRCTKAQVASADRKCFKCGKPGHISSKCTNKNGPNSIRAITEDSDNALKAFFMVDNEGFRTVTRGGKPTRPMPSARQLGNFIGVNSFESLQTSKKSKSGRSGARSCAPTDEAVTPKPPISGKHAGRVGGSDQCCSRRGATDMRRALREAQDAIDKEIEAQVEDANVKELDLREVQNHSINVLYDEEPLIATAAEKVIIRPAMVSGAVRNVIHPKNLPHDAEPKPNDTGRHFVGANNTTIERYGTCETILETPLGAVGCNWDLADVTRPLHSVSTVTGPIEGPGKQDVLFNNRLCVVVPPGVVDKILETIKPVMKYDREGNLYVAEMEMSTFRRQGQVA